MDKKNKYYARGKPESLSHVERKKKSFVYHGCHLCKKITDNINIFLEDYIISGDIRNIIKEYSFCVYWGKRTYKIVEGKVIEL